MLNHAMIGGLQRIIQADHLTSKQRHGTALQRPLSCPSVNDHLSVQLLINS